LSCLEVIRQVGERRLQRRRERSNCRAATDGRLLGRRPERKPTEQRGGGRGAARAEDSLRMSIDRPERAPCWTRGGACFPAPATNGFSPVTGGALVLNHWGRKRPRWCETQGFAVLPVVGVGSWGPGSGPGQACNRTATRANALVPSCLRCRCVGGGEGVHLSHDIQHIQCGKAEGGKARGVGVIEGNLYECVLPLAPGVCLALWVLSARGVCARGLFLRAARGCVRCYYAHTC